jgi:hypothetical protein
MPKQDLLRRIESRMSAGVAPLSTLPAIEAGNSGAPTPYDRVVYVDSGSYSVVGGRPGALHPGVPSTQ